MKTPEEIKKGLIWCIKEDFCKGCPYEDDCYVSLSLKNIPMVKEALAYIQQLESTYSQVSKALCGKENATLDEVLQAVSQVKVELEAVKRERDAAVKDLWCSSDCFNCKYRDNQATCDGTDCYSCELDCPCAKYPCGYEWRGVCLENTEVRDGQV